MNTSLLRRLQYNRLFHMILLALAVVTCYFGLWNAYFVSEDDFYLTGQIWHRDTLGEAAAGLGNGVRFLNYSMIWVKTRLFDLNPSSYYLSSLAQHFVVSILIYLFAEVWTKNRLLAFLAALFYATKFSTWEVVSGVSASDYSFWAIFYLLTLGLFSVYLQRKSRWLYVGSVLAYSILAFAHDFTLSIPLILMAYHLTLGRGTRSIRELGWSDLRLHFPYWILWGIHISIQLFYIVSGTSEAVYSTANYRPGLHMIGNLVYLSSLIVPNIPMYEYLARQFGPVVFVVVNAVRAVVAILGHTLAIYGFWKGSALVRFSLALIYLPFLQYTLWEGTFADVSRYLYLPSIGFCILLALLTVRLYAYIQGKRPSLRRAVPGLVVLYLVFNVAVVQIWIQRHLQNSGFRRSFIDHLTAELPTVEPDAAIYIEVPEAKYTDLRAACVMFYEPRPKCDAFVTGDVASEEAFAANTDSNPVYWVRAASDGQLEITRNPEQAD